jgi:pimeloyl-ACP methyl ester carboxylesterase
MKRTLLSSVLLPLLCASAASAAPYSITATASNPLHGGLVRTEFSVSAGAHPLDRFKVVRIRRDHGGPDRGVILFLPPLGSTFSFYEQRDGDPGGRPGSSIAEYFALRGFDVFGVSPRFEGPTAGTCEAGLLDCSVMGTWNLQSMVEDVTFVRGEISTLHPGAPVALGGASLGSILAIAVADADPSSYDALILWEGMLYSNDPAVLALNGPYCAGLEAQLAAGQVYDAVGIGVFRTVAKLSQLAPGGLTPIPLLPPFLTNQQALLATVSVPTPGPISMPVPGYFQVAGDLTANRLVFADQDRLVDNVGRFNQYVPNVLVRDVSCSLAGVETAYTDGLAAFTGPILAIGGGHGFGAFLGPQLGLFGSTDVTLRLEADFGHIDHMMTPRHVDFVERPIFEFLRRIRD